MGGRGGGGGRLGQPCMVQPRPDQRVTSARRVTTTMAASSASLPSPLPLLLLLLLTVMQLRPVEGFHSSRTVRFASGSDSGSGSGSGEGKAEQFFCKDPKRRQLPRHQVCDGIYDCAGHEDETNCLSCQPGAWKCLTSRECIPELNKCDNVTNCADGSDEEPRRCLADDCLGANRFKCANGHCVSFHESCDGQPVCTDGSDEWNCCGKNEFECNLSDFPPLCKPTSEACDGRMDCPHGEDEKFCASCKNDAFHCRSDVCIEQFRRCDGVEDCDSAEDELGCPADLFSPSSSGRRPRQHGGAEGQTAAAAATPTHLPLLNSAGLALLLLTLQQALCC